jgi:hypothetical protein
MLNGPLVPFDADKPSIPRIHDYVLGGKDNFTVDREIFAELAEVFPQITLLARENQEFVARAVGYVAGQGVTQFIDVGSGMPASPATHESAGLANPDSRVAYVDNDPVVIAHTAALLAYPGRVGAVPGDVRRPADILASPPLTALIDTSEPFCLVLSLILDYIPPGQAAETMAAFRDAMPTGSYLIMSIGINETAIDVARDFNKIHRAAAEVHLHSRKQIEGYCAGLKAVEPGLTEVRFWRPAHPQANLDPRSIDALAYVGRKA